MPYKIEIIQEGEITTMALTTMKERKKLPKKSLKRYQKVTKKERGFILDEFMSLLN